MHPSYPAHWQVTRDHRSPLPMPAWAESLPLSLGPNLAGPSMGVLCESLRGLQVMESNSAELFSRYFGDMAH